MAAELRTSYETAPENYRLYLHYRADPLQGVPQSGFSGRVFGRPLGGKCGHACEKGVVVLSGRSPLWSLTGV